MRFVCVFVLNCIMFFFFFQFGVKCINWALVVRFRPTIRVVLLLYRERTIE